MRRVGVYDHKIETLFDTKDMPRPSLYFGGNWFGLAEDESLLIMQDVGNREIYALDVELQ